VESRHIVGEAKAEEVGPVGGVVEEEIQARQVGEQGPLAEYEVAGSDAWQRRYDEAAQGDTEHEGRDDHRKGEMGGAEGERTESVHRGLQGHHGEAGEQRDQRVAREPADALGPRFPIRGGGLGIGPTSPQGDEDASGAQIDEAHGKDTSLEPQPGDQEEAGRQGSDESAGCVEGVHEGVEAGGILEALRQPLC